MFMIDLERSLDSAKEEREAFIQEIVDEVKGHIDRAGIKAEIDGPCETHVQYI